MVNLLNKNILIKTYCFESGLWYLSKSLYDELSKNNNVFFAPKSKYTHNGNIWVRHYPIPKNEEEFKNFDIYKFCSNKSIVSQMQKCIDDHNIDYIISFETLMNNSNWISIIKRNNDIKIIDVPMPEWCESRFVKNRNYEIFDEIWAVNELTYRIFSDYRRAKIVKWDFADSDIFYPEKNKSVDTVNFCHFSSLNPDFSNKNTTKTILAFEKLLMDYKNVNLYICGGRLSKEAEIIAEKYGEIKTFNNLSRNDVANLYRKCHCIICPSKKEGLGLSIHEAKKCGLLVISTDIEPISEYADFICKIFEYNKDNTFVHLADTTVDEIYINMKKAYGVII